MKILLNSKLLFLFGILLFSFACGNDDDGGGPGFDAGSGKVMAKIDGVDWESKDEIDGAVFASTQGTNILQAFAEDGSFMSLTIFGSLSSGFTTDTSGGIFQANYKDEFSGTVQYSAVASLGSGMITITNFSASNIAGTFEFTGQKANADGTFEDKVISNGSFDIDY